MFGTSTVGSKVTGPFKVDDRILKLKSIFMQDNLPNFAMPILPKTLSKTN